MGRASHHSTSKAKRRDAANRARKPMALAACANCKAPIMPHRTCAFCGTKAVRKTKA